MHIKIKKPGREFYIGQLEKITGVPVEDNNYNYLSNEQLQYLVNFITSLLERVKNAEKDNGTEGI